MKRPRVLWFRIIIDPEKGPRLWHLRDWVVNGLTDVSNVIYTGRGFLRAPPVNNRVVVTHGRPRESRQRLNSLGGLLGRRRVTVFGSLYPIIPWHLLTKSYDLVFTYMFSSFHTICTFAIGYCLRRKPYVVMAEHWYPRASRSVMKWHRLVASRARLAVAQSTKAADYFVSELGCRPERVIRCVNTVGTLEHLDYNPELLTELESDPRVKILCVARFVPFKGQDVLFRAYRRLGRADTVLYAVGDTGSRYGKTCLEIASETENILCVGNAEYRDVLSYYRGCDVFVLPNQFVDDAVEAAESFGYAVLEAAYFGLPVIVSSATGCAKDVVQNGVTGYELGVASEVEVMGVLSRLLDDRGRLERMGRAARSHARRLCSEHALTDLKRGLREVLDEVLEA